MLTNEEAEQLAGWYAQQEQQERAILQLGSMSEQVDPLQGQIDPFSRHFLQLDDGTLRSLSQKGAFSLQLLHLNRLPLVEYRHKQQREIADAQSMTRLQALVRIYEQLLEQQSQLILDQRMLLDRQYALLQRLIEERLG